MNKIKSMLMIAILSIVFICGCTQTETKLPHEIQVAQDHIGIGDSAFMEYGVELESVTSMALSDTIFKYKDYSGNRVTTITTKINQEDGYIAKIESRETGEKICPQEITILTEDATKNNKIHTASLDKYTLIIYDPINDIIYPDLDCYGVPTTSIESPYGECLINHLERLNLQGEEYYVIGQESFSLDWTEGAGEVSYIRVCETLKYYLLHIVRR